MIVGHDIVNVEPAAAELYSLTRRPQPITSGVLGGGYTLEHSNSRFESNRFDSLCESIRIDSFCKKNRLFDSLEHAVFLAYLLYSLSQRISWRYRLRRLILQNVDKNSYAMHTLKITPNSLFDYRCTSGKFIRLPNRIESKLFLPELECSIYAGIRRIPTSGVFLTAYTRLSDHK